MKLFQVVYMLCFAVLLNSCITLYKPNTINSPLIKEKGQINAAGAIGTMGTGIYNLQAAYGISNHLAVITNGMYHTRQTTSNGTIHEKLDLFSIEAGAGFFGVYGAKKNLVLQVYGGGGYGNSKDRLYDTDPHAQISAEYANAFLQPGIAYSNPNFEVSFDVRMNYVNLYNVHAYSFESFDWWNTDFRYYDNAKLDFYLIEPAITLKSGAPWLKGTFQAGVTLPYGNPQNYFAVNTDSYLIFPLIKLSVGIQYTFLRKEKKEIGEL